MQVYTLKLLKFFCFIICQLTILFPSLGKGAIQPTIENSSMWLFSKEIDSSFANTTKLFSQRLSHINLEVNSGIILNISVTETTCKDANGSIIVTATGGVAPYSYILFDGFSERRGQGNGYFPRLSAATYILKVRDSNGDSAIEHVTIKNLLDRPKLDVIGHTKATDCSTDDATITLQATKGLAPYLYSYDLQNFQTENVFHNLSNGRNLFYVKDANGCIDAYDYIDPYNPLGCPNPVSYNYTFYVCDKEGSIEFEGRGPEGPFTYSLNNGPYVNNGLFTSLTSGTYKIRVQNRNGNVFIYTIALIQLCQPVVDFSTVDSDCKGSSGQAIINVKNGVTPYDFTIDGINYQRSNTFTGLAPAVYNVTVRDATGVTNSVRLVIEDRCPQLTLTHTDESCNTNDGTITAAGLKGMPPFLYSLDRVTFQTSNVFSGLPAGPFTVTMKDVNGNRDSTNVVISKNCLQVTATTTDVICTNHNGTATVAVTGGTAPYVYSSDGRNFQSENTLTGLGPADYTIIVRDRDGKTGTHEISIKDQPAGYFVATFDTGTCYEPNATMTLNVVGGLAPFTYSITSFDYQESPVFTNLITGRYNGYVKDANGCVWGTNVWVPSICINLELQVQHANCGMSNGIIEAAASDGIGPYQYSLNDGPFQNDGNFRGLSPGNYTVTVKSADGKTRKQDAIISGACIEIQTTKADEICEKANGWIEITATNGKAPYNYSIDGNNFQTSNRFEKLSAATYLIVVSDADGLTKNQEVMITNRRGPLLKAVTTNASCLNNNGSLQITGNGGTPPYTYSLNNIDFGIENRFTSLSSNTYTTYIKDTNGCVADSQVIVSAENNLTLELGENKTICEGTSVIIEPTSNANSFRWSPGGIIDNPIGRLVHAAPDMNTLIVAEATLGICTAYDSIEIFVHPAPVAAVSKDTTICFGQSVQISGTGGLRYQWSPTRFLQNGNAPYPVVVRPIQSTTYNLVVTNANNCKSINDANITVTVTPPAELFAGRDTAIIIHQDFQLQAQDINNSGFTVYQWVPAVFMQNPNTSNPIINLPYDITYTVRATTPAGCEAKDEISLKVYHGPEIYVPSAFTPNMDGKNEILRAIPIGIKEFRFFSVFDRWGNKVFSTAIAQNGWNPSTSPYKFPSGTYVWTAQGIDLNGNTIKRSGTVTLIR